MPDNSLPEPEPRRCRDDEHGTILGIINAAAQAYRGVIPDDRWHDPYMSAAELSREIAAGVVFHGQDIDGQLTGVMGIQGIGPVELIRHAYVLPQAQGRGIGGILLSRLLRSAVRPVLVGTWSAAVWAIAFYQRYGFVLMPEADKAELLKQYWTVPDRQIETSVVLWFSPAMEIELGRAK